jgi:hypothetical protein
MGTMQAGSFHPLPVIGHPPAFYERHIKQAEAAGDVHAKASHKVGQYITEAIDPKQPWAHKANCFRHVLKHYCVAPEGADEPLQAFYRKLSDLVKRHACTEAIHAAQRFSAEATKRINSGMPREQIDDEADDFFTALLGHERTPEWCTKEAADQIARIRQQWV